MKKCVVTLPITPTANPSFGMIASVIVSDIVARNLGLKLVLALGVQGMRISAHELESVVNAFLSHLRGVGVRPDFILRGDSRVISGLIEKILISLLRQQRITMVEANILVCPCGAVEKLADVTEPYEKRRLYKTVNNEMYCKVCNGPVQKKHEEVYLFRLSEQISGIQLFPEFYRNEVGEQVRNANGSRILVSRTRNSSVPMQIGKKTILFDPDFIWQTYLTTLPSVGLDPSILIGSNHRFRAVVLSRAVQETCFPQSLLNVVVPPYFLAERQAPLRGEEYSIDTLLRAHHKNSLRVLAGESLNWNRKESVVQTSQLSLLDRMNSRFENLKIEEKVLLDLPSFFQRCNHQNIRETVRSVRGSKQTESVSSLFGVVD